MSNFGTSFKKAREALGLPLDRIAADTRISTRFLLAIESEDFHLLPGGVFNRGFIRSYAERLGMDPEQAVTDYGRISATAEEPLDVLRNAERASTRRSERNIYPVAAAILVALIVLYYAVNRGSFTQTDSPSPVEVGATTEEPGIAAPVTLQNTETNAEVPAEPTPAAAVTPATASGTGTSSAPLPSSTSALALDVDVMDATWVHVTADGAVVLNDNLPPGSSRRFSAEQSIIIKLGNAGGASMRINGRDMGSLGVAGQVREFRITPDNATRIQGSL